MTCATCTDFNPTEKKQWAFLVPLQSLNVCVEIRVITFQPILQQCYKTSYTFCLPPWTENHSKTVWYVTTSYRDHSSSPQISTPLRKVRVQEAAPFAVHRGGLYWTTICMMREWGDQMLYISLYLCCNKSGTLGSLFWLDREKMTALGYKKKSDQEVV